MSLPLDLRRWIISVWIAYIVLTDIAILYEKGYVPTINYKHSRVFGEKHKLIFVCISSKEIEIATQKDNMRRYSTKYDLSASLQLTKNKPDLEVY